jgi:two-component SAPR family response regulator
MSFTAYLYKNSFIMARFINKTPSKKYIRPVRYGAINHTVTSVVSKNDKVNEETVEETKVNNVENIDDMSNKNLEKVKALVGDDVTVPKRRVKREKKDKGLIERTEGSEILLTEDNKMLLND